MIGCIAIRLCDLRKLAAGLSLKYTSCERRLFTAAGALANPPVRVHRFIRVVNAAFTTRDSVVLQRSQLPNTGEPVYPVPECLQCIEPLHASERYRGGLKSNTI